MMSFNLIAQNPGPTHREIELVNHPLIITNPECQSSSADSLKTIAKKNQTEKDMPVESTFVPVKEISEDVNAVKTNIKSFIQPDFNNNRIVSEAEYQMKDYLNNVERIESNVRLEEFRLAKKVKSDKWKIVGLYSAAIILNGIGDGLNNTNSKTMGHFVNAASIAVLLSTPFFIDYDKSKWYWYLLTYASLRLSLFDASYNITTKQPVNFIGSTAITDKIYKKLDIYGASKTMGLVVGFTIPLRIL